MINLEEKGFRLIGVLDEICLLYLHTELCFDFLYHKQINEINRDSHNIFKFSNLW